MPKQETTELVRAVRGGDSQAFNRLVLLYQVKIYNLALNYLKNPEEAKDVAQDVFVTAYRGLSKLKDDTKFSAWLNQITINHCRNRYKKLKRTGYYNSQSLDDPESYLQISSGDSPAGTLELKDRVNALRSAIAGMPENEKEMIILRDIQEYSYDEISSMLNLPLGTVKSKLNRARNALKKRLKQLL